MYAYHVRMRTLMRLYFGEKYRLLYAALSESAKQGALRPASFHFDLWPQHGVKSCCGEGCIAGGCIAGGCIVAVISRSLCMFT